MQNKIILSTILWENDIKAFRRNSSEVEMQIHYSYTIWHQSWAFQTIRCCYNFTPQIKHHYQEKIALIAFRWISSCEDANPLFIYNLAQSWAFQTIRCCYNSTKQYKKTPLQHIYYYGGKMIGIQTRLSYGLLMFSSKN